MQNHVICKPMPNLNDFIKQDLPFLFMTTSEYQDNNQIKVSDCSFITIEGKYAMQKI